MLQVILLVLLVLPVAGSSEQAEQPQTPAPETLSSTDQQIRELLYTIRAFRLIKELGLSEDRARQVLEKMHQARTLRQQYLVQRYQIENKLDALLEYPTPDREKIDAVLQELDTARQEYYQHIRETDHELRMILTPEEQARYILFQRKFNQKLREIIASIREQSTDTSSPGQNRLLRKQTDESVIRRSP